MSRSRPEWIATSDDQAIPRQVKARIWLREDGRCYLSGQKIRRRYTCHTRINPWYEGAAPRGLRSLWDMLKESAEDFMQLGQELYDLTVVFDWDGEYAERNEDGDLRLNAKGRELVGSQLKKLLKLAERLNLPTSMKLISRRLGYKDSLPQTYAEFDVIREVLTDELSTHLFLSVPPHMAAYYENDNILSEPARQAFPLATAELREAGNAYAAALPNACAYQAMRALEHGLRALASDVGEVFDAQQWGVIIGTIEGKIEGFRNNGIPGLSKAEKDARLQFLSEAAKEFAYFKDGWRNYVAHVKDNYTEAQALKILSHVQALFETLAAHLKEQGVMSP